MATKEVLVDLSSNKRPVKFDAGDSRDELLNLKKAAIGRYSDKGLTAATVLNYKIKSEKWQGQWLDLEGDEIPDGSCLQLFIRNEVSYISIIKKCIS